MGKEFGLTFEYLVEHYENWEPAGALSLDKRKIWLDLFLS